MALLTSVKRCIYIVLACFRPLLEVRRGRKRRDEDLEEMALDVRMQLSQAPDLLVSSNMLLSMVDLHLLQTPSMAEQRENIAKQF